MKYPENLYLENLLDCLKGWGLEAYAGEMSAALYYSVALFGPSIKYLGILI
jgi:hypothetical protein